VYGVNADNRGFQMSASKGVEMTRNVLSGKVSAALFFADASTSCAFRDNVWQAGTYGVIGTGRIPGTGSLKYGCGTAYQWSGMTLIGSSGGNSYPPGTVWAQGRARTSLADGIRAAVAQATAGVTTP
jgi:hypothetical protein